MTPPTAFERLVANLGLWGCQRDHFHFSVAINGIFWYDPALYEKIYYLLRSPIWGLGQREAQEMMDCCFTQESEGLHRSFLTHQEAMASYKVYVEKLDYLWPCNRETSLMASNCISGYLAIQTRELQRFKYRLRYSSLASEWNKPQRHKD